MNDDYMISFQNETKQTIEASYKKMTAVERSVADFFIGNKDDMDFSSKNIILNSKSNSFSICFFTR